MSAMCRKSEGAATLRRWEELEEGIDSRRTQVATRKHWVILESVVEADEVPLALRELQFSSTKAKAAGGSSPRRLLREVAGEDEDNLHHASLDLGSFGDGQSVAQVAHLLEQARLEKRRPRHLRPQ